jgi:hypothetical protein
LYDMSLSSRRVRRRGPRKPAAERKDYLIQARVPRELDDVLKKEAKRRRLSVSHLIRNVLEDTYKLVDGVIEEVDSIVQDSVRLTGRIQRDARQVARSAAGVDEAAQHRGERKASADARAPGPRSSANAAAPGRAADFEARTADVYAWNPVVLHRSARCERCTAPLARGDSAHLGLSELPTARPRWLCPSCLEQL